MNTDRFDFEAKKNELELIKLELENEKLRKEVKLTWKSLFKNVNILQILTLTIAFGAATAAIRTNYFSYENKVLEFKKAELKLEIDSFENRKHILYLEIKEKDSVIRRLEKTIIVYQNQYSLLDSILNLKTQNLTPSQDEKFLYEKKIMHLREVVVQYNKEIKELMNEISKNLMHKQELLNDYAILSDTYRKLREENQILSDSITYYKLKAIKKLGF